MKKAIEYALRTWYPIDHLLHNDPLHPAIGLAGEAGELLNLYKKERFKDGFSWWDCVNCGKDKTWHYQDKLYCKDEPVKIYIPKILDELGDLWYYLRILAYQSEVDLNGWYNQFGHEEISISLAHLNSNCARLLTDYNLMQFISSSDIKFIFFILQDSLALLDCTLDQLTKLNWNKLKDEDNNGWKSTRES